MHYAGRAGGASASYSVIGFAGRRAGALVIFFTYFQIDGG